MDYLHENSRVVVAAVELHGVSCKDLDREEGVHTVPDTHVVVEDAWVVQVVDHR